MADSGRSVRVVRGPDVRPSPHRPVGVRAGTPAGEVEAVLVGLGLGDSALRRRVRLTFPSFERLSAATVDDLCRVDGMRREAAVRLVAARDDDVAGFVASVAGIGRDVADRVATRWPTWERLVTAGILDLESVEGIGPTRAHAIRSVIAGETS